MIAKFLMVHERQVENNDDDDDNAGGLTVNNRPTIVRMETDEDGAAIVIRSHNARTHDAQSAQSNDADLVSQIRTAILQIMNPNRSAQLHPGIFGG
jgi:hypothetical protein